MGLKPGYKQTEVGVIPDEWEVRPLRDLATTLASGKSKGKTAYGNYPVHGSTGVIGYSEHADYDGDAILVARVGANAGKLTVVSGKYGVTDNTLIVRFKSDSWLPFFWRQLESKRLNSLVFGSGQPLITGTQLRNLSLCVPSCTEQRAIAAALSDVDALISALDRLIAKKRGLKQAAMQQLLTGQRRLPGFHGEWSVRRLGEIGESLIGLTYKPSNVKSDGLLVLRSSNISEATLRFEDNVYVDMGVPERIIVRKGDILICVRNGSRDLIGKCAQIDEHAQGMTFGAFMAVFRTPFHRFVYHQLQSDLIKRQIHEHLGATINQITNKSLNSFRIAFPENDAEQIAIANVLSDMDAEIAALEARRDKTRALKRGMMQELLTGRIRLL